MKMDIVADGHVGNNCGGQAPIKDLGYNIDTGSSCGFSVTNHSLSNTQPRLDALASNSGPTQTMALPSGSPAIDAIPPSTPGCTGTTDQRGVVRPQGPGCDIGAYEVIVTTGDTQAPTVPTGLAMTSDTSSSVSLRWNASSDNVGVTGYTVYRNGTAVGATGGAAATLLHGCHRCTVHQLHLHSGCLRRCRQSLRSIGAGIGHDTVPGRNSGGAGWRDLHLHAGEQHDDRALQPGAGRGSPGWLVRPIRCQRSGAGLGQRQRTIGLGVRRRRPLAVAGDLALFYLQNSASAPSGLTVTVTATSPTYLQGAVSEYSGIATTGALDQTAAASGNSTSVDSGSTGVVGAGELVVGGLITGGSARDRDTGLFTGEGVLRYGCRQHRDPPVLKTFWRVMPEPRTNAPR